MSIIYGTLERLEQGDIQPLIHPGPHSERNKSGFPLKSIATALAGAGMGIALVFWLEVGDAPDRNAAILGPVKVDTALVAEPVEIRLPEVVEPRPQLAEIKVESRRLAPVVFEPKVKPTPPVAAVASTSEPTPTPTVAPVAATAPAAVVASAPAPETATAAMAVVAPAPVEDKIGPVIDRARIALSRGNYALALATLGGLEESARERSEYWFIKGSAHLGLGQLAPAEAALSAARSLAPLSAQVVVQLSILHQEKGEHALAVEMLGDAAKQHPQVPEIYLNLGYSQLTLGAESEARVSFRVFLELTSESAFYASQRVAITRWLNQSPDPELSSTYLPTATAGG